ncbi:MAG: hypothetical protein ACFFE4_01760 [Candidatus Thorarchaeota archaeon]
MNDHSNNIRNQINVAAYFLSQKNYTYDKLCYMLAERQLRAQRDAQFNRESRKREKAAEIFFSSPQYDVLCWLIAELDVFFRLGKI